MMAGSGRELAVAHRAKLPAQRLLCNRDPELRLHTTKTVGLPHARGDGELYDGFV